MNLKLRLLLLLTVVFNCSTIYSQQTNFLTIEQMFSLAEQNSKQIKSSSLEYEKSLQEIKHAKSLRLPNADLSLSASYIGNGWISDRNFSNGTNVKMPHFGNNFSIDAFQVIYSGGGINSNLKMAKLNSQIAELELSDKKEDIKFLLLGNYLELFKLDNQIQIYITNIKQTQLILEQMEAKHEQGVVLLNDITRYELLLQSLQLALLQAKNTRDIINNQMVTILGLENNYVINVDRSIINKHINYQDSQYWLERVNDNSYSLKILEKGINLSEQYKKITVAERIPTIGLFVGDRLDGPILIEVPTINKNFNYWYAGIQLKFNIGAAYKGVSKTRAANIAVSKAKQDYEVVKEHIQIEAESAFIRLKEAYEILSTQIKGLELASQNYEIVNNRFLNDLALLTDMLDASNSKLIAELNVSNAQINIIFNYYKLRRVSGNL